MPIPQTQATLKSYFQNGDTPTEAQFAELIDTLFYLYNAAIDAAADATAASAAAQAAAEAVSARVLLNCSTGVGAPSIVGTDTNVATVTYTFGGQFRVTFTTPFANTNYKVLLHNATVSSKTTTYLDVTAFNNSTFYLAIWA